MLLALGIGGVFTGSLVDAAEADWVQNLYCPPPVTHHSTGDPCEPNPHIYNPGHAPAPHQRVPMALPNQQNLQSLPPASQIPGLEIPSLQAPSLQAPGRQGPDAPMQPRSASPDFAAPGNGGTVPPIGSSTNQFDTPVAPTSPNQSDTQPPSPSAANDFPQAATAADANDGGSNFDNFNASDFQSNFGGTQSSFTSAPSVIGDFGGSGFAQISARIEQNFQVYAAGSGGASPTFDLVPGGGVNPDVFSAGSGSDLDGSNDGFLDTYSISEPLPPTDAPTSPGPDFQFQGGTAVYTNNGTATTAQAGDPQAGELWHLDYTYAALLGGVGGPEGPRPVPSPGVSVRRVKIAENFSAEIRNRAFFSYSFFNDSFGGLGDISRYVVGLEQILVDDLLSLEVRLPVAATYGSRQSLDQQEDRNIEIGNFTLLGKVALLRGENYLWSGGVGVGTPTADDTEIQFRGADYVKIRNETVQIMPFMGLVVNWKDWVLQSYLQLDVAANGDSVFVNSDLANPELGQLEKIGTYNDSTLMHWDVSLHRSIYQRNQAKWLSQVIGNLELHYTSTLKDADVVRGNNFTYTDLQPNFDIVNATAGFHLVLGSKKDVVVTPAMSVPLRSGLDEQFDYEAIVQVNFLR